MDVAFNMEPFTKYELKYKVAAVKYMYMYVLYYIPVALLVSDLSLALHGIKAMKGLFKIS